MSQITSKYMGLTLKNPIIAGASDMSRTVDGVKRLEDAGVGAVVLKSLFEEEIQLERFKFEEDLDKENYRHPEMITVFPHNLEFSGAEEFLLFVKRAKEAVDIPVIASLNAVEQATWVEYAKQLAATGVDGLELNFYTVPTDPNLPSSSIEEFQAQTVGEIRRVVDIPIAIKLSSQYANPLHLFSQLVRTGADGLVLFNRYFQPQIDVDTEQNIYPFNLSRPDDNRHSLRFVGLSYGQVDASLCASTGIFSGADVVKNILAGADVVQVVSALYRQGAGQVQIMLKQLQEWMDAKEYGSLEEFRGKLSRKNSHDPWKYTRAQYAKMLLDPQKVLDNAPSM